LQGLLLLRKLPLPRAQPGLYIVATVATKNGKPTVENVSPGDKLIRVGELETKHATWGGIYEAAR
jgi:hypothetical protein